MARSLSELVDAEIRRVLVRYGLRRAPRRRRRLTPSALPQRPTRSLSPPQFGFDPGDIVQGYVPVPGACMADMEDGEQPFGPPVPTFDDDQELEAVARLPPDPLPRAA